MNRLIALIAVLWVACVLCEGLLSASASKTEPASLSHSTVNTSPEADTNNAALRMVIAMAGQFRVVFANLLWIKVDKYHHEYIEHHGDWTQNSDLLPLLRMITWLDPHFVQAYQVAGFMLSGRLKRYEHARAILEEGIRNNPRAYELHEEMGMAILRAERDYRKAYPYLANALSLVTDEFHKQRLHRLCQTVRRKIEEENVSPSTN